MNSRGWSAAQPPESKSCDRCRAAALQSPDGRDRDAATRLLFGSVFDLGFRCAPPQAIRVTPLRGGLSDDSCYLAGSSMRRNGNAAVVLPPAARCPRSAKGHLATLWCGRLAWPRRSAIARQAGRLYHKAFPYFFPPFFFLPTANRTLAELGKMVSAPFLRRTAANPGAARPGGPYGSRHWSSMVQFLAIGVTPAFGTARSPLPTGLPAVGRMSPHIQSAAACVCRLVYADSRA